MAKNLKIKVKNAQLAEALKKLKKPEEAPGRPAAKKAAPKPKEEAPAAATPPPHQEAKSPPPPLHFAPKPAE